MKVEARQGGGFAGPALNQAAGPVETSEAGEAGARIEALVDDAGFFELPDRLPDTRDVSDAGWAELEVEAGGRHHKVRWTARSEPPDELKQIIQHVVDAAGGWRDVD